MSTKDRPKDWNERCIRDQVLTHLRKCYGLLHDIRDDTGRVRLECEHALPRDVAISLELLQIDAWSLKAKCEAIIERLEGAATERATDDTQPRQRRHCSDRRGNTRYRIFVNGQQCTLGSSRGMISYLEVIDFAYLRDPMSRPNGVLSITYRNGPLIGDSSGILAPGESVQICDGMKFEVATT